MKKQQGMSIVGFLMVLSIVGFVALSAIKIVPAYIEFKSVKEAMNGAVSQSSGAGEASVAEIRESLSKRLSMNYVSSVDAKDIKLSQDKNGYKLSVEYQAERPLVGNIFFLLKFKHEATTSGKSDN